MGESLEVRVRKLEDRAGDVDHPEWPAQIWCVKDLVGLECEIITAEEFKRRYPGWEADGRLVLGGAPGARCPTFVGPLHWRYIDPEDMAHRWWRPGLELLHDPERADLEEHPLILYWRK